MQTKALLATVPSYFSPRPRILNAWGCGILGYALWAVGLSAEGDTIWLTPAFFFIGLAAYLFGTHLRSLRILGRHHRWPHAENTQVMTAFLGSVLLFCVLPGAAAEVSGASGSGLAVGAWAALGVAMALSQLVSSLVLFYAALLVTYGFFLPLLPLLADHATNPSPGAMAGWGLIGALGWLLAATGSHRLKGALDAARASLNAATAPPPASLDPSFQAARQRARARSVFRFVPSLWLPFIFIGSSLENPESSSVLILPLLMPCFLAAHLWESWVVHLEEGPSESRSRAWKLVGVLGKDVFAHWVITASMCALILVKALSASGSSPGQVGFLIGATLLLQPALLAVPAAFLGIRPDRPKPILAARVSLLTLGFYLSAFFDEPFVHWTLAVAPGSEVWKPWLTVLVLGLGALGIAIRVRLLERFLAEKASPQLRG
ncbi:MAG: hypothetical protein AAF725_20655 [Acidobacteriota bacterium]